MSGTVQEKIQRIRAKSDAELLAYLKNREEKARSEGQNGKWIPVDKKMPNDGEYVLVSFDDGEVCGMYQHWRKNTDLRYVNCDGTSHKVDAWMPLPKAYNR